MGFFLWTQTDRQEQTDTDRQIPKRQTETDADRHTDNSTNH